MPEKSCRPFQVGVAGEHARDDPGDLRGPSQDGKVDPLRRAEAAEVTAATRDDLVVERSARQRAAAERRAGLELDRAGRYAESRARMRQSQAFLAAAPMTTEVEADLTETMMLASAPPTSAYESHVRKSAQLREDQRRRGRQRREPEF